MASQTYDEALRRLLAHEGGYSNHPSDPGGPTNFGITIADYRKYIDARGSAADVRQMTAGQAKAIYKSKYWNAMRCDELPAGVDYVLFDYGVNSGTGRAPKVLKRVLGLDASDSVVTPQVIGATKAREPKSLVNAICDERLRFLKSLRTWPVFGDSWNRRVSEVRAAALAMAARTPAQPGIGTQPAPGRGEIPHNTAAKEAIRIGVPTATAVGGLGFRDWVVAHPATGMAIALLTVGTIVLVLRMLKQRHTHMQETPMPDTPAAPVLTQGSTKHEGT